MDAHKQREMLERLRAHLEHKTTDLSAYALKVPAEHYVSDDQLALEVDALFKQRPVLVALTPHIPNEGDYLTHDVIDTSLLLVRDSSGVARAYINACRHRGARTKREHYGRQLACCAATGERTRDATRWHCGGATGVPRDCVRTPPGGAHRASGRRA